MRVSWFFLTIVLCLLGSGSSNVPIKRPPEQGLSGLPVRSLKSLSTSPLTALVATVDGTIKLMDSDTGRVIWSFNSGAPIHSSYQAPTIDHDNDTETFSEPDHSFYVDVEDDWELYAYHSYLPKVKLKASIDDYVRSTPLISNDDRSITLGSRKSTVFEVDAATGRLLRTYGMSDYRSTSTINSEVNVLYNDNAKDLVESGSTTEQRLKITRTDYSLQSFAQKSGSVLWNLTVAEIGASLICPEDEASLSKASTDSRLQLGSDSGDPFAMPLSCQTSAIVYRLRNHDIHGFLSHSQSYKGMPLLGPSSGGLLPQLGNRDHLLQLQPGNQMLPPSDLLVPRETIMDGSREFHDGSEIALMLPPPAPEVYNSGVANVSSGYFSWTAGFFLLVVVGFVYLTVAKARENADQVQDSNLKTPSRKKKSRKLGKSSNGSPQSNGDGLTYGVDEDDAWKKLNSIVAGTLDGRRIGKLCVSNSEIAKGSNGTIVLEGIYEGRPVAVKRLVKAHYDVAIKEIENLIASDRHPNIVRWYGLEDDQDFVYVALERCMCNLDDLIQISSNSAHESAFPDDPSSRAMVEYKVRLDSLKITLQGLDLWKPNGHPSPLLIKLMRDVVSGIVHLHDLGIIHRDLKPQNVLINKERSLCSKVSDMGISKRLRADMSSLGYHVTGCGSSGWQAPEQLQNGRQTRAVDVFSLGCVIFFCITGGRHPFGDRYERDLNIMKNKMDLFLVESIPEAVDLFTRLLNPDPEMRPKAMEVLHHPLFWSSENRLSFLRDMSDRVELEDREAESDLLNALENTAPLALGGKWDEKMESLFIKNIGRYRRYKYDSVRDLLRVMRNKLNHYRELPKEIQDLLGPLPEGFGNYFAGRFPNLLIEVYKVAYTHCKDEECFQKYFRGEQP